MAWIRTIEPGSEAAATSSTPLGRIYRAALDRAGRVFGIVRLQSIDPAILQASLGLYAATTTSTHSPLSRWFRELIAVEVSRANDCHY